MLNTNLKNIMSNPVITTHKDASLTDIKKSFSSNGVHHLPVMDNNKLVGIVSSQDVHIAEIINAKIDKDFDESQIKAVDIMSNKTIAIKEEANIKVAAQYFVEHKVHCLPVLDKSDNLVGLITPHDLMKLISSN